MRRIGEKGERPFLSRAAAPIVSVAAAMIDVLSPLLLVIVLCGTLTLAALLSRSLIEVDTAGAPIRMLSCGKPPSAATAELIEIVSEFGWHTDAEKWACIEELTELRYRLPELTATGAVAVSGAPAPIPVGRWNTSDVCRESAADDAEVSTVGFVRRGDRGTEAPGPRRPRAAHL